MSDNDKRSVTTDALATLGTIIGPNEKRDAIHLAVEPVIAAETLRPGQHITIVDGRAYGAIRARALGIVDPFLEAYNVEIGQRFWFIMYPRQVRSLRHVWSHPAFPDEGTAVVETPRSKALSEKWLRTYCENHGEFSYEDLLTAIRGGVLHEEYGPCRLNEDYLLFNDQDAHGDIPAELWDHVETVTGLTNLPRATHFSCSC